MHVWGAIEMLIRPPTIQDDPKCLVFLVHAKWENPLSPSEAQPKEVSLETILRTFNMLRLLARTHRCF
eukprot:584607-Pyramimonas_sp.AAC.1